MLQKIKYKKCDRISLNIEKNGKEKLFYKLKKEGKSDL
jgi:hypothetical protein